MERTVIFVLLFTVVLLSAQPSRAAAAVDSGPKIQPGICGDYATVGNIKIIKCIDPDSDRVQYFNTVGMMTDGGEQ